MMKREQAFCSLTDGDASHNRWEYVVSRLVGDIKWLVPTFETLSPTPQLVVHLSESESASGVSVSMMPALEA